MKLHASKSAAENARIVLPKMARRYFEAGRKAIDGKRPPDELHAFRLKTKRLRYTLELFSPLYGPSMDRYLKALRELQGALGKVSDYQAIQRVLAGDRDLEKRLEHALKGKLKELRHIWRAFDAPGQLKRWRAYLASDQSKPRTKGPAGAIAKKGPARAHSAKAAARAAG
jgi:CHAD domain-containing protein